MPRTLLLLTLVAGCGQPLPFARFTGDRWIEDDQCWQSEAAFRAPAACDDAVIQVRDPDGGCWTLYCFPDLPDGWEIDACEEVPEDQAFGEGARCEG